MKDEGKGKAVKKESTSNRAEGETSADEVYINSMEIETYASSGKTALSKAKAKKALEGKIRINGQDARALLDTGTIGEHIISAVFVTTHRVETKTIEGAHRILMAMKGSQSTSTSAKKSSCPPSLLAHPVSCTSQALFRFCSCTPAWPVHYYCLIIPDPFSTGNRT